MILILTCDSWLLPYSFRTVDTPFFEREKKEIRVVKPTGKHGKSVWKEQRKNIGKDP